MRNRYSPETFEAVMSLLRAGETPAWRRVREITGKGSSNTILAEVKQILAEVAERASAGDYPKPVQDAFCTLWLELKAAARGELDELRAFLYEENRRAQETASQAEQLAAQTREKLAERDRQVELLQQQLDMASQREEGLTEQLRQLGARLVQEQEKLSTAHLAHQQALAEKDQEIRHWQGKLDTETHHRHQVVAEMATEHQAKVARLELEIRNELERYEKDTARFMRQLDQERTEHRKELKVLNGSVSGLQTQLSDAKQKTAQAEGENAALRRQVEDLSTQRSALEQRNQVLQAEAIVSSARLAEFTERITTLQRAAEQLEKAPSNAQG
ncbi:TPA: DNA-binding protein [Pseudomonas aeruginosa]